MSEQASRFEWKKGEITFSPCLLCRHKGKGATCAAFPDGIPEPILLGKHKHRKAYAGDNGIRFTPLGTETENE